MLGIGFTELIYLILMLITSVWVFFDAPKHGTNKYLAILVTLFALYPLGFIAYLVISRVRKERSGKDLTA